MTESRDDGYEYQLLTEKEWQAAAAGPEGRKYPWGDKWDKNKCNNYKIKIERTSPVGIFRKGDTPHGISDMSGNIWEWTITDYDTGNDMDDFELDQKKDEMQWPVLRGGSWSNESVDCRCAYRYGSFPSFGGYNVGFRCARTLTL